MSKISKPDPEKQERLEIVSYETTYGMPRFLGIPQDDQLIENSSMEGILGGEKISTVFKENSAQLAEASVDWEEGIRVLKYLAIACYYHDEFLQKRFDATKERICNGRKYWDLSTEERESITRENNGIIQEYCFLPGFGKKIKAYSTGARVQYDNPIKDSKEMGDGTAFDLVASECPERQIEFELPDKRTVNFTVNMPTLSQAEAFRLLERGNRYEMTGETLAALVHSFNEDEFKEKVGEWLQEKERGSSNGLKTLPGHKEIVEFSDGEEIEFSVGRSALDFVLKKEPFCRMMVWLKEDGSGIKEISLSGAPDNYMCGQTIVSKEGGSFWRKIRGQRFNDAETYEEIDNKHPLFPVVEASLKAYQDAKESPDGIIKGNISNLHRLIETISNIVNPIAQIQPTESK